MVAAFGAALGSMLAGLAMPLVLQRLVDGPIASGNTGALPWLVAGFLVLGVVEAALLGARRLLVVRPSTRLETSMRGDFFRHVQRLPSSFHARWSSGQLLSRTVSDVAELGRFFAFSAVYLLVNVVALVAGLGVLAWLSPVLALVVLVTYLPMVLATVAFERRFHGVARSAQEQSGDLTTTVEESVLGVRVLKTFGRGPETVRRFTAQARALRVTELRKLSLTAALWWTITALPELGVVALIAVGGYGTATGGTTLGTLTAAVTVATTMRWPADTLGWLIADASTAAAAADRYWQVRDVPVTVAEPVRPRRLPCPPRGELRLENVHYRHPESGEAILRGVDLTVPAGGTLALVGATGSGKSTLVSLLARLDDPTSGRITLDGTDLRDVPLDELRAAVSCAFDEPVLFSGTVRQNVALGLPGGREQDARADERIMDALRLAHADGFVTALPEGLDTRVGEEGTGLSGGQRQRLALARAVLPGPSVLVLDNALSALDVHTEREVEAALRTVMGTVTTVLVAHRPATLRLADQVAVLADGRVAALGTHDELMARDERYRLLLESPVTAHGPADPGQGRGPWQSAAPEVGAR
ncbi:ABC transporter ATP-binding protein [Streptomyces sp. UNOB3_S3]|uniref:ABC transporter ATP-binding protein n=1 Tax=Streptomyces sp. UNOB3_S3 TaxID=2871682 RepID=UPI001E54DB52|nr:ABC transporter ATP-binding protein [Streptomyces sp. UNOB3_S3]MCC3773865.1 ABC transporter ATP-binding protein/permease [Streptomyces sp. UNOB3_S3]